MTDFSLFDFSQCASAKDVFTDDFSRRLSGMKRGNLDPRKLMTALASFCGLIGVPAKVDYEKEFDTDLLQTFTSASLSGVYAVMADAGAYAVRRVQGCVNNGRNSALRELLGALAEPKLYFQEENTQLIVFDNLKQPTSASRLYNVGSRRMLGR